jgi:peroxiredoxin
LSTRTPQSKQMRRDQAKSKKVSSSAAHRRKTVRKRRGLGTGIAIGAIVAATVIVLAVIYFHYNGGNASTNNSSASQYPYQVGSPGVGSQAPAINLPSSTGGTFDLAAMHGKTVLLYFQEGLTCQPCWDQLKDIQSNIHQFQALGINQVVSITTDPLNAIQQKTADEGLTIPVLSDQSLTVSTAYNANQYGMMGTSRDGHTFIVVGPDGRILWRADYGGAPNYTMYVPIPNLIAALREGLHGSAS